MRKQSFFKRLAGALLLGVCLGSAWGAVLPAAVRTPEIEQKRQYIATVSRLEGDLVYKKVGDLDLTLDLMLPLKTTDAKGQALFPDGTPLVIHLHGGGWRSGNRYLSGRDVKFFSDHGIAVASPSYRVVRDGNGCTVETCVIDCFDAVRYLVKHAKEYGLDPSRLFVYGGSAGGHLALMLLWADPAAFPGDPALADAKVKFSGGVAIAPVGTLADPQAWAPIDYINEPRRFEKLMGGTLEEKRELAEKLSPLSWLKKNSARALLIHGEEDTRVNIKGSILVEEKAKAIGADVTLLRQPGADHSGRGDRAALWRVSGLIKLDNLLDMVNSTVGDTHWSEQPWR